MVAVTKRGSGSVWLRNLKYEAYGSLGSLRRLPRSCSDVGQSLLKTRENGDNSGWCSRTASTFLMMRPRC